MKTKRIIILIVSILASSLILAGVYKYTLYAQEGKATKEKEFQINQIYEKWNESENKEERLVFLSELKDGLNNYKIKNKANGSIVKLYESDISVMNNYFINIYDSEISKYTLTGIDTVDNKTILSEHISSLNNLLLEIKEDSNIVNVSNDDYVNKVSALISNYNNRIIEIDIAEKAAEEARIKAEEEARLAKEAEDARVAEEARIKAAEEKAKQNSVTNTTVETPKPATNNYSSNSYVTLNNGTVVDVSAAPSGWIQWRYYEKTNIVVLMYPDLSWYDQYGKYLWAWR